MKCRNIICLNTYKLNIQLQGNSFSMTGQSDKCYEWFEINIITLIH